MDSIGQQLKATRERKRISLSYVAAQTRIKIQYLEMIERDDFSHIPAPAYAKGFLRMYAEFLGMDPHPLVQEYVAVHLGQRPPRLSSASTPTSRPSPKPVAPPAPPAPVEAESDVASAPPTPRAPRKPRITFKRPDFTRLKEMLAAWPWRLIISVVLVVVMVVVLANSLARCVRQAENPPTRSHPVEFKKGVPTLIQELPEPYLPVPAEPAEKTR